ncbi:hypothetical protein PVAG01_05798 [Phlyctema vagabunda]|uniref:Uncharacterized protein n=1 Tax=Phlyctema vagabunda TaxID=108571 RepID=A0ABR4PEU2_9HELO
MQFCRNRPEGFGPKSTISSPLPTSCFVDTILLPLPIWIALAMLALLAGYSMYARRTNYDPSTHDLRNKWTLSRRNCGYRTAASVYYVLIVANFLMQVLEVVRLEILKFGIGLQPFVFVGLLLGALLHAFNGFGIRGWIVVNSVLWIGGLVMNAVQAAALAMEGMHAREGGKYPLSDQVIDVAVMAGVYAVTMMLEIVLAMWRRQTSAMESEKPASTNRRDTPESLSFSA